MPVVKYDLKGDSSSLEAASKRGVRALRKTTHASDGTKEGLEGAKQAAEGFGGAIGGAAGMAEKFGRALIETNKAIGPVGAAIGGVTLGLGAIAFAGYRAGQALVDLIASASEARERLDEIAGTPPLPDESIEALERWDQAALGAEASAARLKVIVAGELADAFEDSIPILIDAAEAIGALAGVIGKARAAADRLLPVARNVAALFSVGTSEAFLYAAGITSIERASDSAKDALVDMADAAEESPFFSQGPSFKVFEQMEKQREAEEKSRIAEVLRARAEARKREAEMMGVANDFLKEEAARIKDIQDLEEEARLERVADYAADYADALREANEALEAHERAAAEAAARQEAIGEGFKRLTSTSINAVGAWGSALTGFVEEGTTAFHAFFAIQQAAAAAGVIVDTSRAVMLTLATVPPPAGPALALATAATGAAHLASIMAASIGGGGSIPSAGGGAVPLAEQVSQPSTGGRDLSPWGDRNTNDSGGRSLLVFRHEVFESVLPDSMRIPGSRLAAIKKNGARVGKRVVRVSPRKLLI